MRYKIATKIVGKIRKGLNKMPSSISNVVSQLAGSDKTSILRFVSRKQNFAEILAEAQNVLNNFQSLQGTNDSTSSQRLILVLDRLTEPQSSPGKDSFQMGATLVSVERVI